MKGRESRNKGQGKAPIKGRKNKRMEAVRIRQSVHYIDCDGLSSKISLIKLLSWRKHQSVVWEYFVNEEYHDKSRCTVPNDKGEKCGLHIAGIHSFISSI